MTKKQLKSDKPWGLGFSVGHHKDVFLYDYETREWWVSTRLVGGPISAVMAKTVRISEGKSYIMFEDALSLSSAEMADKLQQAKARLETSEEIKGR